jgi:hypothetical protein
MVMLTPSFTNTSTTASAGSLVDLLERVRQYRREMDRDVWIGNPRSVEYAKRLLHALRCPPTHHFEFETLEWYRNLFESYDLVLKADECCPEFDEVHTGKLLWHRGGRFTLGTVDPFITYEASDLPWLLRLGFVKPETEKRRVFYRIAEWKKIYPRRCREAPLMFDNIEIKQPLLYGEI